jgi:hypothetical protein
VWVAVANCVHGFPQSECLICQTLGSSSSKSTATKTKVASPPEPLGALPNNGRTAPTLARREEPVSQRGGHGMGTLWAILVAIVVGGLLVWAFAGVVSVAFHIAEYVALALVAGWVGYKLGHARGRRGH